MLRNTPDTQMGQAVMVLCHLALTQAQLTQLPKAVFKVRLLLLCKYLCGVHGVVQKQLQFHVEFRCFVSCGARLLWGRWQ